MREVSESAMNAGGNVQFSFAAAAREIIMAGRAWAVQGQGEGSWI